MTLILKRQDLRTWSLRKVLSSCMDIRLFKIPERRDEDGGGNGDGDGDADEDGDGDGDGDRDEIGIAVDRFLKALRFVSISKQSLEDAFAKLSQCSMRTMQFATALAIRTLPNATTKHCTNYSDTNPCYLSQDAARLIATHWRIRHTVVDLPSVDRADDGGHLLCHRTLWDVERHGDIAVSTARQCRRTITELAYFPTDLHDGLYMLQLQVPNIESDAAMSRPVLISCQETTTSEGMRR